MEYGEALTRIEQAQIGKHDRASILIAVKNRVAKVREEERRAIEKVKALELALSEASIESVDYEAALDAIAQGKIGGQSLPILFAIKSRVAEILESKRVAVARAKEIEEILAVKNGERVGDRPKAVIRV